jgi:hypothetical protein
MQSNQGYSVREEGFRRAQLPSLATLRHEGNAYNLYRGFLDSHVHRL